MRELAALLAVACGVPHPAPPRDRPNILLIVADDQRADSLECMPAMLEAMGAHVVFDEHFVSTPVCCPSRASLLTGLYAHDHGVLRNRMHVGDRRVGGAEVFLERGHEANTLARRLGERGYRTAYFGRYLHGYERLVEERRHVPAHWDDWHAFASYGYYDYQLVERPRGGPVTIRCYATDSEAGASIPDCREGADEVIEGEGYSTDVLRDRLLAFLRGADGPFFAVFAPFAPHSPFLNPARYAPSRNELSAEALDRMRACPLFEWSERPPSYGEDTSDKPAWVRRLPPLDGERLDRRRRRHAVAFLAIEDAVREALALLPENTIVIYTADNGLSWGEHGWTGKNCAYEECVRVPLVIRDPALATTRRDPALSANVDLTSTILEYAGAAPGDLPGRSLVGRVRDPSARWDRDEILTECWSSEGESGPDAHAAVRTARWKYVEYENEAELYDLSRDPHELTNLLVDPRGYDRAELDRALADLRARLSRLRR